MMIQFDEKNDQGQLRFINGMAVFECCLKMKVPILKDYPELASIQSITEKFRFLS